MYVCHILQLDPIHFIFFAITSVFSFFLIPLVEERKRIKTFLLSLSFESRDSLQPWLMGSTIKEKNVCFQLHFLYFPLLFSHEIEYTCRTNVEPTDPLFCVTHLLYPFYYRVDFYYCPTRRPPHMYYYYPFLL